MGGVMARGGWRKGSGPKRVNNRPSGNKVRATATDIDNVQPLAFETLRKAMEATKHINVVSSPRKSTVTTYKTIEVADWHIRVKAASKLIDKRHPDLQREVQEKIDEDNLIRKEAMKRAEEMTDAELLEELNARAKGEDYSAIYYAIPFAVFFSMNPRALHLFQTKFLVIHFY